MGKRGVKSSTERIPLIVVEIAKSVPVTKLARLRKQPARNDASSFDLLIRVRKIHVEAVFNMRRTQR